MKLQPYLWGSVTLILFGCTTPATPPTSDPIAAETAPARLPEPPDPTAAAPVPPSPAASAAALGLQVSQQGGGLGDSPEVFNQVWGEGTLEENFVGWQGTYQAGKILAYFRDFNGTEPEGDRAEQVVLTLGETAGAENAGASSSPDPATAAVALDQALALVPADAVPDRIWQPSPDTFAYRYQSKTLAQVLPEHEGYFVVWLQLDSDPDLSPAAIAPSSDNSATTPSPSEPPDPANPAPPTDSLPPGTHPPEPVLQIQLISGTGDNL